MYTDMGGDTFSNALTSAKKAGYSADTATSQGSRLLTNVKIQSRIREIHESNMLLANITPAKVLCDLEHDKRMARRYKQYSVAARCSELQGKYLAMFTDNYLITREDSAEYDQRELAEVRRIAALLVSQGQAALPALPGATPADDVITLDMSDDITETVKQAARDAVKPAAGLRCDGGEQGETACSSSQSASAAPGCPDDIISDVQVPITPQGGGAIV